MNDWVPFLQKLADEADKIALEYFRLTTLSSNTKQDGSPVTEADQKIERRVREIVADEHPELSILGEEEGGDANDSALELIIDPIDETKNFMRGIPVYGTLLAIRENGEIIAGFVSAPSLHGRWWATKGGGAFYNGEQIHVSDVSELSEAYGFHSTTIHLDSPKIDQQMRALFEDSNYVRGFGGFYQHLLVAMGSGEYGLNVGYKGGLDVWDVAALKIIVEEAGGRCTNTQGEETLEGYIVSTNSKLHDTVIGYFK